MSILSAYFDNNLYNKSNANISDLDFPLINSMKSIDNIDGFEKNEYSSIYDNNFFYWDGPFGVLVPNHIDKIQSIYSNIYLTKDGNLIIKDNQVKESIFIYDKDTYINNFTDSSNGYYIYCNR